MKKEQILTQLQDYLEEHKGIDKRISGELCSVSAFGFDSSEWSQICENLKKIFDLPDASWTMNQIETVEDWAKRIQKERAKIEIMDFWFTDAAFWTRDGNFYEHRKMPSGDVEIKKLLPTNENDFWVHYRVNAHDFIFAKREGGEKKLFRHLSWTSDLQLSGVLLLDEFILIYEEDWNKDQMNAETVLIYNQDWEEFALYLPEVVIKISQQVVYDRSCLSFLIRDELYCFCLAENKVEKISEEQMWKIREATPAKPSGGWFFPDEKLKKEIQRKLNAFW